jgi:hypothetical protein
MDGRQFRWGLSGGASALAIAGFFWYGISLGIITTKLGWLIWGLSTGLQAGITASILWAAVRLRRRSGFTPGVVAPSERQRRTTRRILRVFGWIVFVQAILIGSAIWWCLRSGRSNMIWPWMGLIVSIHFAPLARLFRVRAYYVTALAGTMISLWGFIGLSEVRQLAWFGGAMAAVMWLSGWYVIRNADQITERGLTEEWGA